MSAYCLYKLLSLVTSFFLVVSGLLILYVVDENKEERAEKVEFFRWLIFVLVIILSLLFMESGQTNVKENNTCLKI